MFVWVINVGTNCGGHHIFAYICVFEAKVWTSGDIIAIYVATRPDNWLERTAIFSHLSSFSNVLYVVLDFLKNGNIPLTNSLGTFFHHLFSMARIMYNGILFVTCLFISRCVVNPNAKNKNSLASINLITQSWQESKLFNHVHFNQFI